MIQVLNMRYMEILKLLEMSDGFYDYYSQNTTKSFEELIAMRKQSIELDPIYGKKDDASILVVEL